MGIVPQVGHNPQDLHRLELFLLLLFVLLRVKLSENAPDLLLTLLNRGNPLLHRRVTSPPGPHSAALLVELNQLMIQLCFLVLQGFIL